MTRKKGRFIWKGYGSVSFLILFMQETKEALLLWWCCNYAGCSKWTLDILSNDKTGKQSSNNFCWVVYIVMKRCIGESSNQNTRSKGRCEHIIHGKNRVLISSSILDKYAWFVSILSSLSYIDIDIYIVTLCFSGPVASSLEILPLKEGWKICKEKCKWYDGTHLALSKKCSSCNLDEVSIHCSALFLKIDVLPHWM